MPVKRTAKNAPKGIVIQTLDIKQVVRTSVDIDKWRNALKAAEGTSENRKLLFDLYADMLLDGQLRAVCDKRIMAITNSKLMFVKDGKPVDELWPLIGSKQLQAVLRYIIEAKLFGHSLVEFIPNADTFNAELVDRRHVKPRLGIVVKSTGDTTGTLYREPPFSNFLLEVGSPNDFGLLLQASQYVIYKRGGIGDYADYLQLFGIPFRHGKYKNEETRKVLAEALENMGSAGYAVTPEDAVIEILRAEGATGANLIFKGFAELMNEAIAITILGQSMTTTDSGNAGFAQSKVHQAVEEEVHKDDMSFVLRVLNTDLIPILSNLGLKVEGGEFAWVESDNLTLKERMEIDREILQMVPVDKTYLYETYGIPVPASKDTVGGQAPSVPAPANKKNVQTQGLASHNNRHQNAPGFWEALSNFFA